MTRKIKIFAVFFLAFFAIIPNLSWASTVLLYYPDIPLFKDIAVKLNGKLSATYTVSEKKVSVDSDFDEFEQTVKSHKPDLMIIFDNKFLSYSMKLNMKSAKAIPVISVMSLSLKQELKNDKNTTGIAYEIPPFLLVNSFNRISQKKIKKLGVIFRKGVFDWYIKEAKEQLRFEKVTVEEIALPEEISDVKASVSEGLKVLAGKSIDAFWLVSDNGIINQETFSIFKDVAHSSGIPFICGVKNLVMKDFHLCSFAVTPDIGTIIDQSFDQALAILEDNLAPLDLRVEYLESVNKTLNINLLESNGFNVLKSELEDVEITK